jgi:hypothetical protein
VSTTFLSLQSHFPSLPAGHTTTETLYGTFGANNNPKRFAIREAGGTVFDTDVINQNGGCWKLVIKRQSLTAVSTNIFFEFFCTTTGTILTNYFVNRGTTFTSFVLGVAGTDAGDVTCVSKDMFINQPF